MCSIIILSLIILFQNNVVIGQETSMAAMDGHTLNPTDIVGFFDNLFDLTATTVQGIINAVRDFTFTEFVSRDSIGFLYFIPNTKNETIYLSLDNATAFLRQFTNLTILIPGWLNEAVVEWVPYMASEFNRNTERTYHVIALDWSRYAINVNYIFTAARVQTVGKIIGEFLLDLEKVQPNIIANTYILGQSLGAHVAGVIGNYIIDHSHTQLERITGLDSAAPLFTILINQPDANKLTEDDARRVDLFHTSIWLIGYTDAYGDLDAYFNLGGPIQPECVSLNFFQVVLCSHLISARYFANTINNKYRYIGVECSDSLLYVSGLCDNNRKIPIGLDTPENATGVYYVHVNATGN